MRTNNDQQQQWLLQYRAAETGLELQRIRELIGMSDERAAEIANDLLCVVESSSLPESRISHSGLVDQQRIFSRAC